ncbi:MAG: hypothetical protein MPJ06_04670 [Nitrosopumilus sp.]|nr:hypothetical protein [Nitrosopumilus sp.]MDA7943286.1 hypothetical protein [Nitrosopumilus sp.]MDA7998269.1 hypothetical protein [Nitrosopumilus sp.]MDA7998626.1 hypothetical protein [Nitrosopumilus sp.]
MADLGEIPAAAAPPPVPPAEAPQPVEAPPETFEVNYSCLKCGTAVSNAELTRLPEIKCICGFRVFIKVRPPVVKTVRAV